MSSNLLVVLTLLLVIQSSVVKAALEDSIIEFLEEFRARMCHPIEKLGLPALDPFHITHREMDRDDKVLVNFTASVTNLTAIGLSDFVINEIKISKLTQKFTFDLTFPMTKLDTKYTAKGSLAYIFNLIGNDDFVGHISDVRIVITGAMKISMNFGIRNLKIQISARDLSVEFGRLLEEERLNDFFHNFVNELFLELLGDFWTDFGENYTGKLENLINKMGSNYTLKEIIAMISGSGSGEPIFGDDPPGDCKDSESKNSVEPVVIQQ